MKYSYSSFHHFSGSNTNDHGNAGEGTAGKSISRHELLQWARICTISVKTFSCKAKSQQLLHEFDTYFWTIRSFAPMLVQQNRTIRYFHRHCIWDGTMSLNFVTYSPNNHFLGLWLHGNIKILILLGGFSSGNFSRKECVQKSFCFVQMPF